MNLYCAFIVVPHTQGTQVRITQCYLQITPYLPLPHKRSPDGAYPDWGCRHQLQPTIHVSTSKRMKGWVGLVGWPTADGLPTSGHRSAVGQANEQGKFAGQRLTFYHCAAQPTKKMQLHVTASSCVWPNYHGAVSVWFFPQFTLTILLVFESHLEITIYHCDTILTLADGQLPTVPLNAEMISPQIDQCQERNLTDERKKFCKYLANQHRPWRRVCPPNVNAGVSIA